jgi:HlyD family secretion protein
VPPLEIWPPPTVRWLAEDGALVHKGDKVVELDAAALADTREEKRLAVLRADNDLADATAQATATRMDKQMEVARKQADLDKAAVAASAPADLLSRWDYQQKQLTLTQSRDALAKATEELAAQQRIGRLDQNVRELERERAERELAALLHQVEQLTLRAPRDGLVQIAVNRFTRRKFLVGDQLFSGLTVASLPDLSQLQVRARLSDVDEGTVKPGMAAECTLDAYPDKQWRGSVSYVSPVARAEGKDAARRFFDVVVALDRMSPDLMRPGMSVRVEVLPTQTAARRNSP